jgi:hypothetical protein
VQSENDISEKKVITDQNWDARCSGMI